MSAPAPLIFLIAGEPSGDALGAALMAALKARSEISFVGIGGALMAAEGLTSLFPMKDLTRALQVAAGRYDEAIESCRRFLESSPGSDGLHHILANALLLVNRVEEAQSHLKQALTLNPGNALAASDLAAVHEHFGRLDEALELYRAAARIDPSLEEARESALRVSERLARH